MKGPLDDHLLERLPLPLAREAIRLLDAPDDRSAAAAAKRVLDSARRWIGAIEAAAAGGGEGLAPWLDRVRRALDETTGEPASDAGRVLRAFAANGAPVPLARIGRWTVRLTGPETTAEGDARVELLAGEESYPLHPLVRYDPEADEVVLDRGEPDAGGPADPDQRAAADPAGGAFRIGPFRVIREISRGGQGILYEAWQDEPPRRVALKLLHGVGAAPERLRDRMEKEAAALARVEHPHVATVYEAGFSGAESWISMRLIPGVDLARALADLAGDGPRRVTLDEWNRALRISTPSRGRRLHVTRVAEIGRDLAQALQACHDQGVVHRDVKPGNVMVESNGEVVLADFGLARLEDAGSRSSAGHVVGTLAYVAPERFRSGATPDGRADVYGLGATLYEALTLARPFAGSGGTTESLVAAILTREPEPIRRLAPWVPRDLATIVEKALRKSPDRRYRTAGEMAEDLDRFLLSRPIRARPVGPLGRTARWMRRRPAAATALAGLLVVALVAGSLLLHRQVELRRAAARGREEAEAAARRERLREVDDALAWAAADRPAGTNAARLEVFRRITAIPGPETIERVAAGLDAVTDRLLEIDAGLDDAEYARALRNLRRPIRFEFAEFCCDVLAELELSDRSVEALIRHLDATRETEHAVPAARALARLVGLGAGGAARRALRRTLRRMPDRTLTMEVLSYAPELAAEGGFGPPAARTEGRTSHGDLRYGDELLFSDPLYVESFLMLGRPPDSRIHGQDEEAYTRWIERHPEDPEGYRRRGELRSQRGNLKGAIEDYSAAIELDPEDAETWAQRANARKLDGDPDGAVEDLGRAADLRPGNEGIRASLVMALIDARRLPEAIEVSDATTIEGASSREIRLYRSMALTILGRLDEAEAVLRGMLDAGPEMPEAMHCLGAVLLRRGEVAASLAIRERVVEIDSHYILGWNGLGVSRLFAGDRDGAFSAFREAELRWPALPFPRVNRAGIRYLAGDYRAAFLTYSAARMGCPRFAPAAFGEALAALAAGEPARAKRAARLFRDMVPADSEARVILESHPEFR